MLNEKVAMLEQQMRQFFAVAELDPQIIRTLGASISASSGKSVASETQPVNEAGVATYDVLKVPNRFILIGDQHVPAYDL